MSLGKPHNSGAADGDDDGSGLGAGVNLYQTHLRKSDHVVSSHVCWLAINGHVSSPIWRPLDLQLPSSQKHWYDEKNLDVSQSLSVLARLLQ